MKRVINNTMNKNTKQNEKSNVILVNSTAVDKIVIKDKTTKKIILDKRG